MKTNPIKRALELRENLVLDDKVLAANFSGTLEGIDTSRVIDLMPIVGTGSYPFRVKVNVKELDPLASKEYKTEFFDCSKRTEQEVEEFIRKKEFDFPLWFKHEKDFKMNQANFYNIPFILQVAGCNFHDGTSAGGCWYCFVDDESNNGKIKNGKVHLGIDETIDSMVNARNIIKKQYDSVGKEIDLRILRTSGGEPTIALDWILNLWRGVSKRNLDFVGQLDSNLSTAKLVDDFESRGIFEKNTLEKLAEFPVKVLTALKGSDEENLQSNVQSETTLAEQEYSLKRFLKAGFDIFPQLYNPNPNTLRSYLEGLDSKIENISLRVHIGPLKLYGPNRKRLQLEAERIGINSEEFIVSKKKEWDSNYNNSCEVIDKYLRDRHGVGYKEVTRSDVKLKVK